MCRLSIIKVDCGRQRYLLVQLLVPIRFEAAPLPAVSFVWILAQLRDTVPFSINDERYDLDIGLPVYWSGRLSPGNFRCPVRLATSPERSAVAAYRRSPLYLYQII